MFGIKRCEINFYFIFHRNISYWSHTFVDFFKKLRKNEKFFFLIFSKISGRSYKSIVFSERGTPVVSYDHIVSRDNIKMAKKIDFENFGFFDIFLIFT
jgi:hypothetical protein